MNKLFNSNFEISLRILLTLSVAKNKGKTVDDIAIADFITIYSKKFGLSDTNLHGDTEFSFSEFGLRRLQAHDVVKSLVLENMLSVSLEKNGFYYSLSKRGFSLCKSLTSDYAKEYKSCAIKADNYISSKTQKELFNIISREHTKSLRKE